jgi:hypothetical protein
VSFCHVREPLEDLTGTWKLPLVGLSLTVVGIICATIASL